MRLAALFLAGALFAADDPQLSRPFLEVFFDRPAAAKLAAAPVSFGGVRGYAVHPDAPKRFPVVLVLAAGETAQRVAREIAQVGYAALAFDPDPQHAAEVSPLVAAVDAGQVEDRAHAAIYWLRSQPFADTGRIGAIAWGRGARQALMLAQQGSVRAAIVTGETVCGTDPVAAPVLSIGPRCAAPPNVQFAAGMFPEKAREETWVAIYEFFGKHLEDAAPPAENHIARIVDIMRVINSDDGVKGRLSRTLASAPGEEQWELARSQAAILAESGNLLLRLDPPKGDASGWREQAAQFRSSAENILRAIEARNLAAAQEAIRVLPKSCASCHALYR